MIRKDIFFIFPAFAALTFASCDDGHVDDPVYVDPDSYYSVVVTGVFHGKDQWADTDYTLCLAGFDDDGEYSKIQKDFFTDADVDSRETMTLNKIPTSCTSIQVAVVDALRRHLATIYKYEIDKDADPADTIKIDLGSIDVSPFGAVNAAVFQALSCSKCHQGNPDDAAGHLNLEASKAYSNLVGVPSYKSPASTRVVPGDAANSFLYKVLTEGDDAVHYSHSAFFVEDYNAPLLKVIKVWIDGGAEK